MKSSTREFATWSVAGDPPEAESEGRGETLPELAHSMAMLSILQYRVVISGVALRREEGN